jgi:glycosyltransferase involved in cell wall biosynthesis
MTSPRISVLLPVYNGAASLAIAIRSVLDQTFGDFELLVIDDGSTDATAEVVRGFDDPRIRYHHHANRGLAATINRGVALARGEYVARQDHDDVSKPERFARQVAFLDAHPNHGLLGTAAEIWSETGPTGRNHDHPTDDVRLRFHLLFDNPFVHSSVMLRRAALLDTGDFATSKDRQPEDYEFWSRLSRRWKVANLPERLLIYREVPGSISRSVDFAPLVARIGSENIAHALGLDEPTPEIVAFSQAIHKALGRRITDLEFAAMERLYRETASRIEATHGETGELAADVRRHIEDTLLHMPKSGLPWRLRWKRRYLRNRRNLQRIMNKPRRA